MRGCEPCGKPQRRRQHDAAGDKFGERLHQCAVEIEILRADREPDHQQEIDPGSGRGRERQTDLRQRTHQRDFQRDIDGDPGQCRLHRRRGILAGVEGGDRAADQHEWNQSDRIGGERGARGRGVGFRERAAREHRPHDDVGHRQERRHERHRKQQREIERPPLRRHRTLWIVRGQASRHLRQQHGADCDPDHTDRQLIEAVGVVQRGKRPGRQQRRDDGIGKQRDLRSHRTDGRGPERAKEGADIVVELGGREPRQDAATRRILGQQEVFENARDQDAPRGGVAGAGKERRQRQRRHHRKVEKDRRRRGAGEAVHDVEHAAIERHQRDQQQIGKRDPRQRDREFAANRIVGKPRRQYGDHLRHEQPSQRQQNQLRQEQQGEDAIGEQPGRGFAALAAHMRVGRHERRIESAFGENRAEMVGQPQRHEKRVSHRPGAEDRREHDVACKAGQPRKERIAADGEDASEHAPLLQHGAALQNGEIMNICLRMIFSENRTPPSDQVRGHTFRDHAPNAPRTALMTRSCVGSSR